MGKIILIVDDSSTMRKIVNRSLRQAGLEFDTVLEAGDGQEAMDLLANEKPDIILSDINMPNMDGIEFLKNKANDDSIKDIPVVMVTTEGGSQDMVDQSMTLGASGCVKKPFTPDQVNEVLGPLL
ncbi:two-component system chemotaxis response regulator CheY [Desulfosalsimonas propionicica]|uniref:Two-component system chemotaxis response regulator CheY n=1 Tax=Desulfosalsimonas propionicica TaxID=332175 RepID=A0A7W0CBF3_9BACT|nr:response regulator [Desulfosalsimonas propionicica]MBA2882671.1 two-component system chemotaxis response regulator CheY [Desulfosalsimonas propionicica]